MDQEYEKLLLRAARNGNEKSLEELCRLSKPEINEELRKILPEQEAGEVLEQTLELARKNLSMLPEDGSFATWTQLIARDLAKRKLEKKKAEPEARAPKEEAPVTAVRPENPPSAAVQTPKGGNRWEDVSIAGDDVVEPEPAVPLQASRKTPEKTVPDSRPSKRKPGKIQNKHPGLMKRVLAMALSLLMLVGGIAGMISQVRAAEVYPVDKASSAEVPSEVPEAEEVPSGENTAALEAYRGLLEIEGEDIRLYTWQRGYYGSGEMTPENTPRPVVLKDIYGDETPELIYVKTVDTGGEMRYMTTLNIVTYLDSQLKYLYTANWDVQAGGGFNYYLYQTKGDKSLRAYESYGDETWTEAYVRFEEKEDGTLTENRILESISGPGEIVNDELQYTHEYYVQGSPVEEEEFLEAVQQEQQQTESLLMNSRNSSEFAATLESSGGSEAKYYDEQMQELQEKTAPQESRGQTPEIPEEEPVSAPEETEPSEEVLDPATLPEQEELHRVLNQFYGWYWDEQNGKEYDSEKATDGTGNILARVCGHGSCAAFYLYPGIAPEDHWNEPDPMGWSDLGSYAVYDGPTVHWILSHIFHVSDEDIETLAARAEEQKQVHREGDPQGSFTYLIPIGGVGDPFQEAVITGVVRKGDVYEITYDMYFTLPVSDLNDPTQGEYIETCRAEMMYEEIDGTSYWTMLRNTSKIEEEELNLPAPDLFSTMPTDYYFSSGAGAWGTSLTVNSDGTFTGGFHDQNLGESGEGYDVTIWMSNFSGKFKNPVQVNDYTYSFELESLNYEQPVGTEEIITDEYGTRIRYAYTTAYGIDGAGTLMLYPAGTSQSRVPEDVLSWMIGWGFDSADLERAALYNTADGSTFFSVDSVDVPEEETAPEEESEQESNEVSSIRVKFDNEKEIDLNWGWDLFQKDASEYDHNLAMASIVLSQATELSQSEAESRMKELGFENPYSLYYGGRTDNMEMPSMTFASHKIQLDGKDMLICAIAVRGSTDAGDWLTDFHSQFDGFYPTSQNVRKAFISYYEGLEEYYGFTPTADNTILLITGHSYGGAAANSMAQMLEGVCGRRNRMFIYTFAAPHVETFQYDAASYTNVHNIINTYDIVPKVPFGYKRYGHEWYYSVNNWSVKDNHILSTYLDCMVNGLPSNMGEGVQNPYSHASIHCPVDVQVLDENGNLIARSEGAEVYYSENPTLLLFSDGESKEIYAPADLAYTIVFEGTDTGVMNYTQEIVDDNSQEILKAETYQSIPLKAGLQYGSKVRAAESEEMNLYELDEAGKPVREMKTDGTSSPVGMFVSFLGWIYLALAVIGALGLVLSAVSLIRFRKKQA